MKPLTPRYMKNQSGVVLIVALVMLVIMSILGITSVRTVALEEKMSAAAHDRSIALQAAEAALLAGQRECDFANRTANGIVLPEDGDSLTYKTDQPTASNGFASTHDRILADDWMVDEESGLNWADDNQTRTLSSKKVDLGPLVTNPPRYFIEYRGTALCPDQKESAAFARDTKTVKTCKKFRITARSQPANGRAEVILQSEYVTN